MSEFQITCTEQVPSYNPSDHARIVAVGARNAYGQIQRWTVDEVVTAIDRGHYFYTIGEYSGRKIYVEKYYCTSCGRYHIRTRPDDVRDNNLDSIARCS